jgi:hypothetical protein
MKTFVYLTTALSLILSNLFIPFTISDAKAAAPDVPDALPLIQFSQTGYQTNEEDNFVEATITLSEPSAITVTVNVTSTGVTAAIGNDFIPIFSQFELLPGQTALQVSVDIMDDWQVEPDETFLLALSEPSGAVLGPQTTTIVTIMDNDGFVDTGIRLAGSPSSWVDYDNDGDLDLLTTSAILYQNNGQGVFTRATTTLPTFSVGFSDWADYDNDGDMDVLLYNSSSSHTLQIYRNDGGGNFSNSGAIFPAMYYEREDWGDFDNDGDLDLLITGDTSNIGQSFTKIYRNDGSAIFVDIGLSLEPIGFGDCAWADFDNDGDLDFALTGSRIIGSTLTNGVTFLYQNNGNSTFTKLSTSLTGLSGGSISWGDYDRDGDLDFLVDGCSKSYSPCPYLTKLYSNNSGTFVDTGAVLPGAGGSNGHLDFGDYDNDGDLDILLTGIVDLSPSARVYRNDGGIFTDIVTGLDGYIDSKAGWADYDNDGDLDIVTGFSGPVTRIYKNKIHQHNTIPGIPTGLNATVEESAVTLNWQAPTDMETPSGSLSYGIWVGIYPGGRNVSSPMSNGQTGYRQVPEMGTIELGTSARLVNLQPNRDYYWRVQSVDSAFAGSPFSAQGTFRTLPASVRFTQGSQNITESNNTVPIGISLSTVSYQTITIDYSAENINAQPGFDYQPISGTITLSPGQTQATIMLPVYDDNFKELNETFRLNLTNPNNVTLGTPSSTLITIIDNDTSYGVCFSQPDYSTSEMHTNLIITTTLCGVNATVPITVSLNSVGGTATQGVDYQLTAQTITFMPGKYSQIVNTNITNDQLLEGDETILYQLSNPISAVIGNPGTATGVIHDDETPSDVSFDVPEHLIQEVDGSLPITVTLSTAEPYEVVVKVNDVAQTAQVGQDYEPINQTVTFSPGETQQIISISVNDDTFDENNETFLLHLSNPENARLGTITETVVTLIDNDPLPSVQFFDDTVSLGESQGYTAITVTLSTISEKIININYSTITGTASTNDFIRVSGIITYSPGTTSQTIYISPVNDSIDEDNENFTLNLSNPINSSLSTPATISVKICDDDNPPSIQFLQSAYQAGEGDGSAHLEIAISETSELPIAVDFEITGGSASLFDDYSMMNGPTIIINPGEITSTIRIDLLDDLLPEGDETIQFSLSSPINSVVGDLITATFTIIDNDMSPIAMGDAYSITEDLPLSVGVQAGLLANDHDPDSTNLAVNLISGPNHGKLTLHIDGSFVYTPTLNYSGDDTFIYAVSDGLSDDTATVSLTILPINDAPDAVNDNTVTTERTPIAIYVLENDIDLDGDSLTIINVTNPLNGDVIYSNGVITYTPSLHFIGVDTFGYTTSDGELIDTAEIVVTVNKGEGPVAVDDSYTAIEDTPLIVPAKIGLLANDIDRSGQGLTVHLISNPLNGTLKLNNDGSFMYTPNHGFKGNDRFTYRVFDGVMYSLVVDVVITVNVQDSAYKVYLPIVIR